MEEFESLPLDEARAFGLLASQYPLLYRQVKDAVETFKRTCEGTTLSDVIACRDACHQLVTAAQQGRFVGVAYFFYQGYVTCCQALIPYAV